MEINEMTLADVEARMAEIVAQEGKTDEAETRSLLEEMTKLNERKVELEELEKRKADAIEIENGASAKVIEKEENEERGNETMTNVEYRDLFYAMLKGNEEARSTLISVDGNGTGAGDAIAIPVELDEKIWDNIHNDHPILADITTVRSGVILEVTKHTNIASRTASKKDGATGAGAEDNTFVKVQLVGKDYEKYVELTYAEAQMSNGALEDYLAQEIAAELGEALAKDVFAQIISDAGTGRKVAASGSMFADVTAALGKADMATKPVIYCSPAKFYEMFGEVDTNGQPVLRDGVALGAEVKKDSACGSTVVVVDPSKFILNEVSPVLIESEKDVKSHHVVVSGWMRAQGTMRVNGAAAYIQ